MLRRVVTGLICAAIAALSLTSAPAAYAKIHHRRRHDPSGQAPRGTERPTEQGTAAAASSHAATLIAVTNPSANCTMPGGTWPGSAAAALNDINACRAQEGVGPLLLPNNWTDLTAAQQLFTVIDLERVNRGLPPVVGLTDSADADALTGAENDTDPTDTAILAGPDGRDLLGMGSIWAGTGSVLEADLGWMYEDGWAPGGSVPNLDCTGPTASGCWGHRDNILDHQFTCPLTGGGGSAPGSLAFALVWTAQPPSDLNFTWASESAEFNQTPGLEPS